ncbi:MAG: hypothetical protein LUF02_01740 [Erysipelotrichaceae bacterium]|nr:hypothetical protein [Erysipelotrichaceae bacterium]
MNKLETFVQENTDDILPTQFRIYVIMLYYFNIYRDPPAIRFHYELLKDTSMNGILVNSKELIRPFSESCILAQNDEMYDLLVTADNAVRRELNLMYMQNGCNDMADIKELVSKIYTVTGQLFSYDLNLIHQYIDESYDFMLHHIDKRIHLLI